MNIDDDINKEDELKIEVPTQTKRACSLVLVIRSQLENFLLLKSSDGNKGKFSLPGIKLAFDTTLDNQAVLHLVEKYFNFDATGCYLEKIGVLEQYQNRTQIEQTVFFIDTIIGIDLESNASLIPFSKGALRNILKSGLISDTNSIAALSLYFLLKDKYLL